MASHSYETAAMFGLHIHAAHRQKKHSEHHRVLTEAIRDYATGQKGKNAAIAACRYPPPSPPRKQFKGRQRERREEGRAQEMEAKEKSNAVTDGE